MRSVSKWPIVAAAVMDCAAVAVIVLVCVAASAELVAAVVDMECAAVAQWRDGLGGIYEPEKGCSP